MPTGKGSEQAKKTDEAEGASSKEKNQQQTIEESLKQAELADSSGENIAVEVGTGKESMGCQVPHAIIQAATQSSSEDESNSNLENRSPMVSNQQHVSQLDSENIANKKEATDSRNNGKALLQNAVTLSSPSSIPFLIPSQQEKVADDEARASLGWVAQKALEEFQAQVGGSEAPGACQSEAVATHQEISDAPPNDSHELPMSNSSSALTQLRELEILELEENKLMESLELPTEQTKLQRSSKKKAIVVPLSVQTRGMMERNSEPKYNSS